MIYMISTYHRGSKIDDSRDEDDLVDVWLHENR